jgi:hypothetical protein
MTSFYIVMFLYIMTSLYIVTFPVRIRVRIDLPHPLVCHKRRLNGAVLRIRPEKTEVPCHSRCGTIKIPHCSKALSAEYRPKFAALHLQ